MVSMKSCGLIALIKELDRGDCGFCVDSSGPVGQCSECHYDFGDGGG